MDEHLRLLQKRVLEDNNEVDKYKLRLSLWRQGKPIKPLPGDTIEFRGQSERTRGVLINKYPTTRYPPTAPQWWINRSYWIIQRDNCVYAFLNTSRLKIIIIELAIPGIPLPNPIPFKPIFFDLSRCWHKSPSGFYVCTLPYKHHYQHYNDNARILWD